MENIFDILFGENICFAIGKGRINCKIKSIENSAIDYFIIIKRGDLKNNEEVQFGFKKTNCREYYDILEKTMNEEEISIFKNMLDKFIKVQSNKNGRIFELKDNSFKEYYKT